MPCSSSRWAGVAMSDHPGPQRLGLLLAAVLFPALVMQPGHRLLDVHGPCAAASNEAPVIRRRRDHQLGINTSLYRRQEFFARGLLRIVVLAALGEVPPEGLKLTGGLFVLGAYMFISL